VVDGQALASSRSNAAGVLFRGIRAEDLNNLTSIAKTSNRARSMGSTRAGVAIGRRLADQLSLHAGDSVTLVAAKGRYSDGHDARIKPYKISAVFEIGMTEYDSIFVGHAASGSAGLFSSSQ